MRKFSKINPEQTFTLRQLAEAGPYCEKSIRKFIATGQLQAYMPAGKYVVKKSDWDKFINQITLKREA